MTAVHEICDRLRVLVPFLQFKKREKHPWRSVIFSKVAGFSLCRLYCEEGGKIDWMNVERRNKSNAVTKNIHTIHCVKSVRIWSYSGPHFSCIFLHSFEYSVSLCIQSDSGKMWENVDQNNSEYGHFLQNDLDGVSESLMVVLNPADGDYSLVIFNGIF